MNLDSDSLRQLASDKHKIEAERAAFNRLARESHARQSKSLGALLADLLIRATQTLRTRRQSTQKSTELQLGGTR